MIKTIKIINLQKTVIFKVFLKIAPDPVFAKKPYIPLLKKLVKIT